MATFPYEQRHGGVQNAGICGEMTAIAEAHVNRKPVILATVAIVIAVTAFVGTQSKDDPLDAVRAAPDTHKVAFENAFVRVLDVHVPPGSIENRHRHPHGLSVYFTDWTVKVTVDGRAPEMLRAKVRHVRLERGDHTHGRERREDGRTRAADRAETLSGVAAMSRPRRQVRPRQPPVPVPPAGHRGALRQRTASVSWPCRARRR